MTVQLVTGARISPAAAGIAEGTNGIVALRLPMARAQGDACESLTLYPCPAH